MFPNRYEAGTLLADRLLRHSLIGRLTSAEVLVLSIPRGGVIVGAAVAEALDCAHDVIVVKKIGFPGHEEFAVGAIAEDGEAFLNQETIAPYYHDPRFVQELKEQVIRTQKQVKAYIAAFRQGQMLDVAGKTVIVVDDGIATGETVKAAVRWLKLRRGSSRPRQVIVAAPVGSPATLLELRQLADDVICLLAPEEFHAVGQFYYEFEQVSDDEVKRILVTPRQKA